MTRHVLSFTGRDTADNHPSQVDVLTGQLALVTDHRDEARRQRDDARDELANMVDLTREVGRLGDYLKHTLIDRDDYRESADYWRDRFEDAQVRMDEMAAEIRELKQAGEWERNA